MSPCPRPWQPWGFDLMNTLEDYWSRHHIAGFILNMVLSAGTVLILSAGYWITTAATDSDALAFLVGIAWAGVAMALAVWAYRRHHS